MNFKSWLFLGFSALTTVVVFQYIFARITWGEVADLILELDLGVLSLFIALSITMSVLRTWRYLVLLKVLKFQAPRLAMFLTVLVRNLFSDLLPARIGSLAYVFIANTRLGVPLSAATSTFAVAFLFDIIAVAPLILLAVLVVGGSDLVSGTILIGASVGLGAVALGLLLALPKLFSWAESILDRLPVKSATLAKLCERVSDEIKSTTKSGVYLKVLLLSVGVRVAKYASLYVFLLALLFPQGYTINQLSIPKVFLGLCSAELAASLPISGIAGFGAYEGAWALTFQLLGFEKQLSLVTGVAHHLFTQVYGYSLGLIALLLLWLPFFKAPAPPSNNINPRSPQ